LGILVLRFIQLLLYFLNEYGLGVFLKGFLLIYDIHRSFQRVQGISYDLALSVKQLSCFAYVLLLYFGGHESFVLVRFFSFRDDGLFVLTHFHKDVGIWVVRVISTETVLLVLVLRLIITLIIWVNILSCWYVVPHLLHLLLLFLLFPLLGLLSQHLDPGGSLFCPGHGISDLYFIVVAELKLWSVGQAEWLGEFLLVDGFQWKDVLVFHHVDAF
jgi:hypothetical protein